jgi:uncharacterized protein (DUF427 family)
MPKGESLYHRHPDYEVRLDASPTRRHARFAGETVADSAEALVVRETKHDPVVYFPRKDVRFDLLERTDHHTFCPFKGEASYWTLRVGERVAENAVWGYEDPFEEVAALADYVAFYPDRVEVSEA